MQQVAQPWVVLSISHSNFWIGLDSFALNAPGWFFTLWGGLLADRHDRKKIILFFQSIQFLCIIALLILLVLGWLKVWMIVLISFLVGSTDALSMPSFQSIVPSLVDKKDISRAVSFNSTQFNLSRILGPVIAGVMMVHFGAIACFGVNAFSYVPFFLSLYWIYPRDKVSALASDVPPKEFPSQVKFGELLKNKEVQVPLVTVLVTGVFCSPVVTFCPVLIKDVFHADVGSFGGAIAAFGVGGLLGAAASLISLPRSWKRNTVSGVVAVALALTIIAIGLNRSSLFLLSGLLALAGATLTVSNISANSFLQEWAGNSIRGRMASLFQLALHGGISVGSLATGLMVTYLGVSKALILNGALAAVLQIGVLLTRNQSHRKW